MAEKLENFGMVNLANCEIFAKIFPTNIHKMYLRYALTSLFVKIFLVNSFCLY